MTINETWFHDAVILKVVENSGLQSIDFFLDYPINWDNNIFAHRVLRFTEVINYHVSEIPFGSPIAILNVIDRGEIEKEIGSGRSKMNVKRSVAEIQTNAGIRLIEYSNLELLEEI